MRRDACASILRRATVPSGGGGRRDAEHDVWAQVEDIFPASLVPAAAAGGRCARAVRVAGGADWSLLRGDATATHL